MIRRKNEATAQNDSELSAKDTTSIPVFKKIVNMTNPE